MKYLVLIAALIALAGNAHAQNTSQTPVSGSDCSVTIAVTNTWQQVLKQNVNRSALQIMNLSSANNMGISFLPIGNNNVAPAATGIGSAGVFTLTPLWSYEPDGGFIWSGEVWVIGTSTNVLTCRNG